MDQKKDALARVILSLLPDSAYARAYARDYAREYAHAFAFSQAHDHDYAYAHDLARDYAHTYVRYRARSRAPFTEDQKAQIDAAYALIYG